jgi:hypothetical protein
MSLSIMNSDRTSTRARARNRESMVGGRPRLECEMATWTRTHYRRSERAYHNMPVQMV